MLVSLCRGMLFSMWPSIALQPLWSTALQCPVLWSWSYTASLAETGWPHKPQRPFCSISLVARAAVYFLPLGSLVKCCYLLSSCLYPVDDIAGSYVKRFPCRMVTGDVVEPVLDIGLHVVPHPEEHSLFSQALGP